MLNRVIATFIFIGLHIIYYIIFKNFLSGSAFVLSVYACTLITFVFLDGFLLKLKHKKRGGKHERVDSD